MGPDDDLDGLTGLERQAVQRQSSVLCERGLDVMRLQSGTHEIVPHFCNTALMTRQEGEAFEVMTVDKYVA